MWKVLNESIPVLITIARQSWRMVKITGRLRRSARVVALLGRWTREFVTHQCFHDLRLLAVCNQEHSVELIHASPHYASCQLVQTVTLRIHQLGVSYSKPIPLLSHVPSRHRITTRALRSNPYTKQTRARPKGLRGLGTEHSALSTQNLEQRWWPTMTRKLGR